MRFNPPTFDAATVADKVADEYGLTGEWAPLVGERDQNFRLSTEDGRKFVVKIAGPDEDPDLADFQVQALLFLEKGSPQIPVPRIIRAKTGRCLSELANGKGVKHVLRIITYLDLKIQGSFIVENEFKVLLGIAVFYCRNVLE